MRMWERTEYERLIYLDADSILMRNADGLFELHGEVLFIFFTLLRDVIYTTVVILITTFLF